MITVRKQGRTRVVRWPSLLMGMAERGVSEEQMASALGVSVRTVNDYRRGTRAPHEGGFRVIADLLGIPESILRHDAPLKKFRRRYANNV